jgi:molybdate transport system substrate-binding protein
MGARTLRVASAAIGVVGILSVSGAAAAAELVVLSSQGSTPGVIEVANAFARTSGHKVTVVQETGAVLERRINNGPADVIASSPEPLDDLLKSGKVVAGTVVPWVLADLGVSVRAGAPKPDISTVEAYKAALLAAKSIGYSYGCSGSNVAKGIHELGLTEQLKAKTVRTGGGTGPVTEFLAKGDFEIGIQQTNIMMGAPGTDYVGVPPGFLNKQCQTSIALMTVSKEQDAARALLKFMASPEAAPLVRKTHVEPVKR